MGLIRPPVPAQPLVTRGIRGFPLRFRFDPTPVLGRVMYYRGLAEERSIVRLRQLLKPGMTFVDVGANVGLYSVVAAHCVGPSGRVIAFEPQLSLAERFWENIRMNRLANVTLEPVALGNAAGASTLFQVSRHDMQATLRLRANERSVGREVEVVVRTLSDVLRERGVGSVDGIKIDVEGAEIDVLEGFESWMKAAPPQFIFFECIDANLARFGHRSRDLVGYLQDHGYTVHQPVRTRWVPVVRDTAPLQADLLALHGAARP